MSPRPDNRAPDGVPGRTLGLSLAGVAGVLALLGLGALVVGGIAAMAMVLPLWAASLAGAASLFVAAGLVALAAHHQVTEADRPVATPGLTSVPDPGADPSTAPAMGSERHTGGRERSA